MNCNVELCNVSIVNGCCFPAYALRQERKEEGGDIRRNLNHPVGNSRARDFLERYQLCLGTSRRPVNWCGVTCEITLVTTLFVQSHKHEPLFICLQQLVSCPRKILRITFVGEANQMPDC